jgi:hypothetical protein
MSQQNKKSPLIPKSDYPVRNTGGADFQRIDYWEYCDNCGQKLIIRKCEFICENCGFFHSCSEP